MIINVIDNILYEVIWMKCTYQEYVTIFKALSDETRLRIVGMLSDTELCACKILESFQIKQPTLSYHMKILCNSGLVNGRRDGAWMKYRINREKLEAVRELFNYFGTNRIPYQNSDFC